MKKTVCDYCGEECENSKEYMIPSKEPIEARDGITNVLLCKCGYQVKDVKKDICSK